MLEAYDTKMTNTYFGEDFEVKETLCKAYLSDEIFNYNGITYHALSNPLSAQTNTTAILLEITGSADSMGAKG